MEETQSSSINNNDNNIDQSQLKSKISKKLDNLNQSSEVFDEMINDYNDLYQKYINIQIIAEQNQRLTSINIKKQEVNKMDQSELEKQYKLLQEEYIKVKNSNEKNLTDIKVHLETIMDLRNKVDIKDKKITAFQSENVSIKMQYRTLENANKELNELKKKNEKEIFELKKRNQKLEIDYKKLLENSGKMYMELDKLRNKLLDYETNTINKINNYNQLIEEVKQKQKNSKNNIDKNEENIIKNSDKININEIILNSEEIKIPNKLMHKQKLHYKGITSINFNIKGSSYITTSEDNTIHIYDEKNAEINVFTGFENIVSDASFDFKEQFLFASSYDNTAKLWNLKNNKLLSNYTGHKDHINCIKCLYTKSQGLTGSSDNSIKEWDFNTNNTIRQFNCMSPCFSIDVPSEDNFILSGHMDGTVKMWDQNESPEKELNIHKDKIIDIRILNNNSFLTLSKDKSIKLFDLRKEEAIYTIDESKIPDQCDSSLAISSDQKYFAVGSNNGIIYIINLNDGSINTNFNNSKGSGSINGLCWRPLRSQIYVGDSNGFLSIWGNGLFE